MKRLLTLISALCITSLAFAQSDALPKMFAHRGCWSKICPENSLPAVARAKQHGYIGIECDVKMTADGKMVIMHDRTINRTCRNASDYSKIEGKINISDLTFKELRKNYVLASPNTEYRMPVPTLEELLKECKKHNVVPMLHSKYIESYRLAQKIMGDDWVCFTKDVNALKECRKFSKCLILYAIDEKSAETAFEVLPQLGGRVGVSSMKREALTRERNKRLRELGYEVQSSIYKAPREVYALRDGVSIILSDFSLMPDPNNNPAKVVTLDPQELAQGQTIRIDADKKVKDGGVAIDIEFEGVVEIAFDKNSNIYTLHNSGNYHDRFGMRFINQKGLVTIHGVEATKIKSAKIYFYEF
jgi:hypothetical protein